MTPRQVVLVKESLEAAAPLREWLATLFVDELLAREPALRPLVSGPKNALLAELWSGLAAIVDALEWLAVRQARRGVVPRQQAAVAESLIATLETGLDDAFSLDHLGAWSEACREILRIMAAALEEERLAA